MSALRLGQPERAATFFRAAQEARSRLPLDGACERSLAHLDNVLGYVAMAQGDLAGAEALFAGARDRERLQEPDLGVFP